MIGPFLFLDIDGVLNRHQPHGNGYCGMDPEAVAILNGILLKTGAKIILSSAWRYFVLRGEMNLAGLQGLLCTHGLRWGHLVDILPEDISDGKGGCDRGQLVQEWFQRRFCISHSVNFACLDDLDLGYRQRALPFVQTDPACGLAGDSLAKHALVELLSNGGKDKNQCAP